MFDFAFNSHGRSVDRHMLSHLKFGSSQTPRSSNCLLGLVFKKPQFSTCQASTSTAAHFQRPSPPLSTSTSGVDRLMHCLHFMWLVPGTSMCMHPRPSADFWACGSKSVSGIAEPMHDSENSILCWTSFDVSNPCRFPKCRKRGTPGLQCQQNDRQKKVTDLVWQHSATGEEQYDPASCELLLAPDE